MHERFPAVERLQYHLPNQQMVLFNNDDECAGSGNTVSYFQNDANGMVQNNPRIGSYTKPYVRSILSTMGVESEVEVMDNA
jgi:hypothetical protein